MGQKHVMLGFSGQVREVVQKPGLCKSMGYFSRAEAKVMAFPFFKAMILVMALD